MRICILENEPESPAGFFGEWAVARGHRCSVLDVPGLAEWPDPREYELIVPLGAECSVHSSPEPWIDAEVEFLGRAHRESVPVFGICFGAQALAAALGGGVRRASAAHGEWRLVDTLAPEIISAGPWLRYHEDVFEVPAGGRLLAGTEPEPLAFSIGASVGVQFHPEATREIVDGWLEMGRQKLASQGIDEGVLLAEVRRGLDGARERAFDLFDGLSARWPVRRAGRLMWQI